MPPNTAPSHPPASSSSDRAKQKHSDLEGCLWPDPDPIVPAAASETTTTELLVDDVSRQSQTRVDRVVFPWDESEVVQILQEALEEGKQIAIRGTQHSMGGHATCQGGIIVDTKYLSHIRFESSSSSSSAIPPTNPVVSVGPGCTWSRVIRFLNGHGKSPKTMQSYSSFSVGGTLAVNAHGITTETCLIQDIQSFRLVHYEYNRDAGDNTSKCARLGQVITSVCHRPSAAALASGVLSKEEELFRLVVGGYGLFGIVTEVSLQISENLPLLMDSMVLSLVPPMPSDKETKASKKSEFESIWEACQEPNSGVEVKLARLNIHTLETASLHIFRRASDQPESADFPLHPREMSKVSQLLYKWALPVLSEHRFAHEEATGQALDMGNSSSTTTITKNQLLFESALPLAKLYSPLVVVEDTFILQEYFCPRSMFSEWIHQARPIYRDIHDTTKEKSSLEGSTRTKGVVLLNTTIRFVEHDKLSFLNYAKSRDGMYAFVLYFRVEASGEMDCMLGQFHNRLAEMTVDLGG